MEPASQTYDFQKHLANARTWEIRQSVKTRKLSDWNCGRNDPQLPVELIESASQHALYGLTTYTETATSLALGDQILNWLRSHPNAAFAEDSAVHLYGNATQALFAAIYTVRESLPDPKFLLIHPSYYATHDVLSALRVPYVEHWRTLVGRGRLDTCELDDLWRKHRFNSILVTDPMYSTGIEFSHSDLQQLVSFARERGLWIVIDSAFAGLNWGEHARRWLDIRRIQRLGYEKCILVDSPSKRLFTNNLKLGVVHCSNIASPHLEKISDSFTGNITGTQFAFAQSIFSPENQSLLLSICEANTARIKRNFAHLCSIPGPSDQIHFISPDSGFHTMLFFKGRTTGGVNAMDACAWLVNHGVFALPTNDYYYHHTDPFGFRVNLMNEPETWQDIVEVLAKKEFS